MIVKIGDERVIAKNNIMIIFNNGTTMFVDGSQTKFIYKNPNEVKTVAIDEENKKII